MVRIKKEQTIKPALMHKRHTHDLHAPVNDRGPLTVQR